MNQDPVISASSRMGVISMIAGMLVLVAMANLILPATAVAG